MDLILGNVTKKEFKQLNAFKNKLKKLGYTSITITKNNVIENQCTISAIEPLGKRGVSVESKITEINKLLK